MIIAAVIGAMLDALGDKGAAKPASGFSIAAASPELIDAWLRLMRLVDRPSEAALLAPMIEREILFRVLQGPQGNALADRAA